MNGNLSITQFSSRTPSVTRLGAMPIQDKFDGPAPIKESSSQDKFAPNANLRLPKPGFY